MHPEKSVFKDSNRLFGNARLDVAVFGRLARRSLSRRPWTNALRQIALAVTVALPVCALPFSKLTAGEPASAAASGLVFAEQAVSREGSSPSRVIPASATAGKQTTLNPMVPLAKAPHAANAGTPIQLQPMKSAIELQRLPVTNSSAAQPQLPPTRLAPFPKIAPNGTGPNGTALGGAVQRRRGYPAHFQIQSEPIDEGPVTAGRFPVQQSIAGEELFESLEQPIGALTGLLPRVNVGGKVPANTANSHFADISMAAIEPQNAIRVSGDGSGTLWGGEYFTWVAPNFFHQPLYFEQVNLERYGHHRGRLQPAISGAHFFGSIALLPYKVFAHPPCESIYTLGHHRPGNCNPHQLHYLH